MGTIKRISPRKISLDSDLEVQSGESVAVDGVCLTVVGIRGRLMEFDFLPQTWETTAFRFKRPGDRVNLELPATPSSFLSGHIVQGHVDGIGTVREIRPLGEARRVFFAAPKEVLKYLVDKGSVAVNGVSLTVSRVTEAGFYVELIPETLRRTNLGGLKPGDRVNLEADVIGKYIFSFLEKKK